MFPVWDFVAGVFVRKAMLVRYFQPSVGMNIYEKINRFENMKYKKRLNLRTIHYNLFASDTKVLYNIQITNVKC